MNATFHDALRAGQCFLFDGSTPTVLYERGVYINRSFDEANLASPDLVEAIHGEFRAAGAQVLTTNTWAANRMKLQGYGLAERLKEINLAGARLARRALQAEGAGWVAGCIGPLGVRIEPWGPTSFEEARACFAEQALALMEGGVDLFVLESFADLNEIHQAILAIKETCGLPVVAQMTPNDEGQTLYGTEPEWYVAKLAEWGADLVGVNGGTGPAPLLDLLKRFRTATACPLILQPSAGLPRMVDGRYLYMASPEYLGEFARQAFQLGARAVGGCAGTTPAHTRAMQGALRQERAFVEGGVDRPLPEAGAASVPRAEASAFSRKLSDGGFVVSVELVPPRGVGVDKLVEKAAYCRDRGADTINVPDGPRAMARLSALATAVIIQERVGIEALMHFACRDRNLLGIQSDLLGAAALGVQNVLAITGDPPKLGPYPNATAVFDVDAIGLTNILRQLNSGLDLGGSRIGVPTRFSFGVGANPVAVDLERERARFRYKVEAGAEWAITQPVFDADALFRFLEFADPFGIPVIAGIWPLKSLRNAEFMANEVPGVTLPPALLKRMARWPSAEDQLKEGLDIALEIIARVRPAVRGLQLSAPLGQVELLDTLLDAGVGRG
ncbi:bifunctional homocysteine S-methyltransferase/methylenetetrahydrofolate reductase [Mesoterricola sediminis]|uniref:Bifunctional homocysteine S-methyltransferase/methylenetetrahydrofolate reductase n=1 Tax=Mesoterricola sediminis TaxID=2927980 RepID=A0AA48HBI0_9BACT|nr:bifunctional homocysteine S-methyltransferase/methylenetetrahydrofolate reductase [Mesoterricola sediminis]BDU75258.1 bifunctional homocysteine S-methyltransferase/methylenetetrahydrofolate reductase [Mesoterricola sediminis]